jgi:hypothetical protein
VVIEEAVGGNGNDTLVGNSANNVLNGRAGDDTAVFSGNRASYAVQNLGDRVVVTGPDGTDTLFSIEHLKFADATIDPNAPAAPVQPARWSLAGVRDLTGDGTSDALWYDATTGRTICGSSPMANGRGASTSVRIRSAGSRPDIGDLNGDGINDLLWHNPTDRQRRSVEAREWPMGRQRRPRSHIRSATRSPASRISIRTARATCSGITRRMARPRSGRSWAATGAPRWTSVHIRSDGAPTGIGDFNHDGTPDIAWYNSTTGNLDIWQILNGHWNASIDLGAHPAGWAPAASAISIMTGRATSPGTIPRRATSTLADREWPLEWQLGRWLASGRMVAGRHRRCQSRPDQRHRLVQSATGNVDIWQIVNAHWAASVSRFSSAGLNAGGTHDCPALQPLLPLEPIIGKQRGEDHQHDRHRIPYSQPSSGIFLKFMP